MKIDAGWVAREYDRAAGRQESRRGLATRLRYRVIDRPQIRLARGRDRVLEIGCGTGRLLAQASARLRVGIDLSDGMLREAAHRPGLRLARADAHRLPFADGCFDAVLAGDGVFVYLDAAAALAECARVLAPGGAMALHQFAARTWTLRWLLGRPEATPWHVGDLDALRAVAGAVGLEPVAIHLWRSSRLPPFALPVPRWLPGHWWRHCTLVFHRL